ncbi:uncharacterized protein [Antedon mediterranea]|uniref:uncharacterized protein n=1 Tax=Antedon mediterranea TaxID=105859 RepID=UPI003AF6D668
MAGESEKTHQSPLKSLSSFRSEIMDMQLHDPGEGPSRKQSALENIMNSIIIQVAVLLLVFICIVATTTELLVELGIIQVRSDGLDMETLLEALSATTLSILSVFIVEVLLRLIGMGASFFKSKLEIFDVAIVLIAFILDLVFHVCGVNEEYPGTIAASNLIVLRCWRFYGIIHSELLRMRRIVREEMDMERYARRQAEAQADALQSQYDQQLKEITQLRDVLRQNEIDPEYIWTNRASDLLRTSNRDKLVKRYNGPVLSASSYNSDLIYAVPSKASSSRVVSRDISFSSRETLPKSTPLSRLSQVSSTYDVLSDVVRPNTESSDDNKRHSLTEKFASTLSRNIIRDAIYSLTQTMASISNGQEGYINFAFDHNVEDGMSSQKGSTLDSTSTAASGNSGEIAIRDGSRTPLAFVNLAFDSDGQRESNIESSMASTRSFEYSQDSNATKHQESLEVPKPQGSGSEYDNSEFGSDRHSYSSKSSLHLPLSGQNSSSNSSKLDADEEEQLRLELEEIKRLSEEALLQELGQSVTLLDERGIPTTSL